MSTVLPLIFGFNTFLDTNTIYTTKFLLLVIYLFTQLKSLIYHANIIHISQLIPKYDFISLIPYLSNNDYLQTLTNLIYFTIKFYNLNK